MQGLRGPMRLHAGRREPDLHASAAARHEGEHLAPSATFGSLPVVDAGGASTAFSGDRARSARRKAVDGPEASHGWDPGAAAPDAEQDPVEAPWRPLSEVCTAVVVAVALARLGAGPMAAGRTDLGPAA